MSYHSSNNSLSSGSTRVCHRQKQRLFLLSSVSWDVDGIIMEEQLQKGQALTIALYTLLLRQLRLNIKTERRGKFSRGILFH